MSSGDSPPANGEGAGNEAKPDPTGHTPTAPMATLADGAAPPALNAAPTMPAPAPAAPTPGVLRVRLFGRTDVGRIREHNEDNFLVADLSQNARGLMENIRTHNIGPHGTLFAVCDGMGGAAAGEVASKLAVDIIYEQMQAGGVPRHRDELARRLVRAVEVAGLRIFAEAKLDRNRRGMGTTATAAALMDDHLFLAQVGDSRAYLLRGEKLELVTRDQSLVNQLIEAGQLTEEEAENFEHSNIILQALGTADSVQVDLTYVKLKEGDTLLLCSDGLSGMVRAEELRQALLANPEPIDVCKVLTDRANEAGGHDNITVIVARFEGAPKPQPGDDPLKYAKYVFQTPDDGSIPTPEARLATPAMPPPVASGAAASTDPTPASSPVGGKLGVTQVGMNSNDLIKEMKRVEEQRAQAKDAAAADPPVAERSRPSIGERVDTKTEMRAAGLPSNGMSAWIWIATILALGLVGVGIYALFGGKLPP